MFHIYVKGEQLSLLRRGRRRGDKSVGCAFQSKKMHTLLLLLLRMKEIPFFYKQL